MEVSSESYKDEKPYAIHKICIGEGKGKHIAICVDSTDVMQSFIMKNVVFEIAKRIPDTCSVSLVSFNTFNNVVLANAYKGHPLFISSLHRAWESIKFNGISCYADVLGFDCDEMYLITSKVHIPPFKARDLANIAKKPVHTVCIGDGLTDLLSDLSTYTSGKHVSVKESFGLVEVMFAVDHICDTNIVATCVKIDDNPVINILYEGVSVFHKEPIFDIEKQQVTVSWFTEEKHEKLHTYKANFNGDIQHLKLFK